MGERVHQEDEDKLKATIKQKEKDRTITGEVTANAGTNLNTSGLAITNPETEDNDVPAGEIREAIINLLYAYDGVQAEWQRLKTDGAGSLLITQTSSGDMARKDPWDRNAENITSYWGGDIGAGAGWTVQLTYTVPSDHIAFMTLVYIAVWDVIATAGKDASSRIDIQPYGGTARTCARITHFSTTDLVKDQTWTALAYLLEDDAIIFRTQNQDTANHYMSIGNSGKLEFDA